MALTLPRYTTLRRGGQIISYPAVGSRRQERRRPVPPQRHGAVHRPDVGLAPATGSIPRPSPRTSPRKTGCSWRSLSKSDPPAYSIEDASREHPPLPEDLGCVPHLPNGRLLNLVWSLRNFVSCPCLRNAPTAVIITVWGGNNTRGDRDHDHEIVRN